MINESNFMDDLLEEVETKEKQLQLAHVDIVLGELGRLILEIQNNFEVVETEKIILDEWALQKNTKIQDRIDWITKKLEVFMDEQGEDVKTIDLPNGKLMRRKQQPKIEIVDLELFMQNDNLYQLGTAQPEIIKPNLNMIKAFIKMTTKIPKGVKFTEQKEEKFSIKIKQNGVGDNGTEKA